MTSRPHLTELQRESLWKWRWLGWAKSTPAFKASIGVLVVAAAVIAVVLLSVR